MTVVTLWICTSLLTRQAFSPLMSSAWLSLMKTVRLVLEWGKICRILSIVIIQVDMKIMYYELIKMITAHERDNCKDEELYDSIKSVAKI